MELQNKIEGFKGEFLHPSLDIKDNILILGFRYKSSSGKDESLILVVKGGGIRIVKEDSFLDGEKEYFLEKKGRSLIRIQERWDLTDINQLIEDYSNLKIERPNPQKLFEDIKNTIKRYVELEKEIDYSLVAAWIIGTYFHPIFSAYPFLNPKAPKRSGKSQLLNLLRQLCFNAVKARPTLAALGDTVDALRGTYLIDQSDSLSRKGGEELLDILADSYKRGGGKRRMVQIENGKRQMLEHETYSPKVFASIRELPEDLLDRCLIVPLIRSQRNFLDPDEDNEIWREIRARIYKFLIEDYSAVETEYAVRKMEYKRSSEIVGRTLELWLPFETILRRVSVVEEELMEAKKRFMSQYGFAEYEPSELEIAVIEAILEKIGNAENTVLAPRQIAENISVDCFHDSPTPKQAAARVGWAIKKFNLSSEKKSRTREGVCYLFEKSKVEHIHHTYFPTQPAYNEKNEMNPNENVDVGIGVSI